MDGVRKPTNIDAQRILAIMDDLRRLLRGGNLGLTFDVSYGKQNETTDWVDEFPKFNRLGRHDGCLVSWDSVVPRYHPNKCEGLERRRVSLFIVGKALASDM